LHRRQLSKRLQVRWIACWLSLTSHLLPAYLEQLGRKGKERRGEERRGEERREGRGEEGRGGEGRGGQRRAEGRGEQRRGEERRGEERRGEERRGEERRAKHLLNCSASFASCPFFFETRLAFSNVSSILIVIYIKF
jgi:hypothetical protein